MTYRLDRFDDLYERWAKADKGVDPDTKRLLTNWILSLRENPYPACAHPIPGADGLYAFVPDTFIECWYVVDEGNSVVCGMLLSTLEPPNLPLPGL